MAIVRVTLTGVSSRQRVSRPRLVPSGGVEDSHDGFQITFDPEEEPIEEVIPNAVAVIHNVDPGDLEPFFSAIDPDALHRLMWPSTPGQAGAIEVSFVYEGLEITVEQDGTVRFEWR